jgi:hypothetical protein
MKHDDGPKAVRAQKEGLQFERVHSAEALKHHNGVGLLGLCC